LPHREDYWNVPPCHERIQKIFHVHIVVVSNFSREYFHHQVIMITKQGIFFKLQLHTEA
jgi:hypothetical protein